MTNYFTRISHTEQYTHTHTHVCVGILYERVVSFNVSKSPKMFVKIEHPCTSSDGLHTWR